MSHQNDSVSKMPNLFESEVDDSEYSPHHASQKRKGAKRGRKQKDFTTYK